MWRGPPLGSSRDGRSLSLSVRCLLADASGIYERVDFLCRPYCVICPESQFHMRTAPLSLSKFRLFAEVLGTPALVLRPRGRPCPLVVLEVTAAPALGAGSFTGVVS